MIHYGTALAVDLPTLLLPQQSSVVLQAAESPTTSDMEMRVCADEVRVNEDTY